MYLVAALHRALPPWHLQNLSRAEDRAVQGDGQGGGGALSIAELVEVFKIDTDDPILIKLSIIHTDSAKAYRRMGPLRWPAPELFILNSKKIPSLQSICTPILT